MSDADTLPREELLLGGACIGASPLSMTKWRGKSRRIYVVGIYLPRDLDPCDLLDAVVIAVRRDGSGFSEGIAKPARVTTVDDADTARTFLAVLPKTITEIHLHRLEPSANERARIVEDLRPE